MDTFLSFVALRPVPTELHPGPDLTTDTDFQQRLRAAPFDTRPEVAAAFTTTPEFVADVSQVHGGELLLALLEWFLGGDLPTGDALGNAVRERIDGTYPDYFDRDAARARDSVLACYLAAQDAAARSALSLVRGYDLVDAALSGSASAGKIDALLRGPLSLPAFILERVRNEADRPDDSPDEPAPDVTEQITALIERHRQVTDALAELALHDEDELDLVELGERTPLSTFYLLSQRELRPEAQGEGERRARPQPGAIGQASMLRRASERRNVLLSARALDVLSSGTKQTLSDLELDPREASLHELTSQLQNEQAVLKHRFDNLILPVTGDKLGAAIGVHYPIYDPRWSREPVDDPEPVPPVSTAPPGTHTEIRPLGVADLLLVRTHLTRYERDEVATLENVLAQEKLTHTIRRLDSSDTTITTDVEHTDLRTQAQSVAENETGHPSIQAVAPGVGPLVAAGPSTFAKAVTDQVSTSASSRTRALAVRRRLSEHEDRVEHLIDNADGATTRHGVYQWLNKVYAAQTFSYGSRLLYELVVPDPAALFREVLARPRSGLALPTRPARFTVQPTDLTEHNWAYYVAGHGATGVEAPPPPEVIVTEGFGGRAADPFGTEPNAGSFVIGESRSVRIPKGYRATKFRLLLLQERWDPGFVRLHIGAKLVDIGTRWGWFGGTLRGEVESLPVGVIVDSDGINAGVTTLSMGIEIVCERTDQLMQAWQTRTHAAIVEGNARRFSDYEERVANRNAGARILLQNMTSARKAEITHTELKRSALAILTGQNFSGFNAVTSDGMGFPHPVPAATDALSTYIRFFEQVVEWEHLGHAFYPYFWSTQSSWLDKILDAELDAPFARFLRSGAARVVLPVRLGYEAAFERFLGTGQVPPNEELLDVGGPLWVSLVDQLRHEAGPDGREVPVGEPWEFTVASDLMWARKDDSMPRWTLSQGTWLEVSDPAF